MGDVEADGGAIRRGKLVQMLGCLDRGGAIRERCRVEQRVAHRQQRRVIRCRRCHLEPANLGVVPGLLRPGVREELFGDRARVLCDFESMPTIRIRLLWARPEPTDGVVGPWDLEIEGLENIPKVGGAIIAPNHLSVHDSTVLLGVLPRLIRFIGKAEYVEDWTTRFAFLALGNIPVDRTNKDSGAAALDASAAVLESGDLFGIFPEGTRSRDGLLHKGKTGAARLALRTGCPIIPVGLTGTDEMQSADDPITVMRMGKNLTVKIGEPIPASRYANRPDQALAPRQMTDDVMFEIRELSGQTYVDEYMKRPDEVA